MAALHDEASYEMYGCIPQDVYNMPTGRYMQGVSSLGRDQTQDRSLPSGFQPIEIDSDDSGDIDVDDIDIQSWNDDCNNQTSSCLFVKVVDVGVQTDDIDITFSINNKVPQDI